jgi:hypothetical protein
MTSDPRDDATGGSHEEDTPPPPGPTDHGGEGGMATREVAPEIAEGHEQSR